MKTIKLLAASLLALAIVGAASAQTHLYVSGSTAFRSAFHQAVLHIINPATLTYGYQGGSLDGASQAIFKGTTTVGGISVIIKTAWAGSLSGVQPLVSTPELNAPALFIVDNPSVTLTSTGTANIPAGDISESHVPNAGMSDSFQGSTPFVGGTYDNAVDTIVGVVPFRWCQGNGTSPNANLTNITTMQAQNLLSGGLLLSEFTGLNADEGVAVYCVGRDADSGTRLAAFADSLFGIRSVSQQYYGNGANTDGVNLGNQSAGTGTITTLNLWPASTVLGTPHVVGDGGFFSGGKVKDTLNRPIDSGAGLWIVSYLGLGDANGVNPVATAIHYTDSFGHDQTLKPTQNGLSWNGVSLELVPPYTSLLEGKYDFWGYEHLLYRSNLGTTDANAKTVANQIANQLKNTDAEYAGVGVLLGNMQVHRDSDGSPILPGAL